jgi:hypothetical protein
LVLCVFAVVAIGEITEEEASLPSCKVSGYATGRCIDNNKECCDEAHGEKFVNGDHCAGFSDKAHIVCCAKKSGAGGKPTKKPAGKGGKKPAGNGGKKPAGKGGKKPAGKGGKKPAAKGGKKPAGKGGKKPAGQVAKPNIDDDCVDDHKPAGKAAPKKTVTKPAKKGAKKPAKKAAKKPAKPAKKPAKPAKKPAKPAKKPAKPGKKPGNKPAPPKSEKGWQRSDCEAVAAAWLKAKPMFSLHARAKQFITHGKGLYRTDCSGFVSAAWNVAPPGWVTRGWHGKRIAYKNLQRCDMLLCNQCRYQGRLIGHAALFWGWHKDGRPIMVEEYKTGRHIEQRPWYASWAQIFTPYRRNEWA